MTSKPNITPRNFGEYIEQLRLTPAFSALPVSCQHSCILYAENLYTQHVAIIYDLDHFCNLVGYSREYVSGAAAFTDRYYRVFSVPKKNGQLREISEPLPSLKEIQRWILENILIKIPVNPAAKAFRPNYSIKENARFHTGQPKILTVDIKDFFPSIQPGRVFNVFRRIGYSPHVSSFLTDLCSLDGGLPQGAPTSPALSNLVMRSFDNRLLEFARNNKIRYTRYADDITISGDFDADNLKSFVYRAISEFGFLVNDEKTRLLKNTQRQLVTGIVVNHGLRVSRSYRMRLRQISYFIQKFGIEGHMARIEEERSNYREHLLGRAGFANFIRSGEREALKLREILEPERRKKPRKRTRPVG